jgi:hypothetical protein
MVDALPGLIRLLGVSSEGLDTTLDEKGQVLAEMIGFPHDLRVQTDSESLYSGLPLSCLSMRRIFDRVIKQADEDLPKAVFISHQTDYGRGNMKQYEVTRHLITCN